MFNTIFDNANYNEFKESDGYQLLNLLQNSENMMEEIIEFCKENNFKIEEVGYFISEKKDFKMLCETNFKKFNNFR